MKRPRLQFIFVLFLGLSLLATGCARDKFLVQEENTRRTARPVTKQIEKKKKGKAHLNRPGTRTAQNHKYGKRKSAKAKPIPKRNNAKDLKSNTLTATAQSRKILKPKPGRTEPEKELGKTKEQSSLSPI